jgi:transketolase
MGIPLDEAFYVSPQAYAFFETRKKELAVAKKAWQTTYEAWGKANPQLSEELSLWYFNRSISEPNLPSFAIGEKIATRNASGKGLAAVAKAWPNLVGGSADLMGPNVTQIPADASGKSVIFTKDNPGGRYIHFGVREHGMGAIANGLALHGGLRSFVATFLVFADYLRPAIRLAALMKLPVLYVMTHDSVFIGEDGPTHQPVETIASLRAIPGLAVVRPADAEETAVAWRMAMERLDGPTVLVLSRQNLPVFVKDDPEWPYSMGLGAYVAKNSPTAPDATLLASGSEISLAMKAAELVAVERPELALRIVSVPDREAFFKAPAPVREAILASPAKVFVAEAGVAMGWERVACPENILSVERFGESGPGDEVAAHLGFTAEAFAAMILKAF